MVVDQFSVVEGSLSVPGGQVRGITPELIALCDTAMEDRLVRKAPASPEVLSAVKTIKRYIGQQGWSVKVSIVSGVVYWQVVPRRVMAPEHKARLHDALTAARAARAEHAEQKAVVTRKTRIA